MIAMHSISIIIHALWVYNYQVRNIVFVSGPGGGATLQAYKETNTKFNFANHQNPNAGVRAVRS